MRRVDAPTSDSLQSVSRGGVRVAIANDADDHAANLTGWKQAYDQLAPGRFRGTLREFWLGSQMQVFEETTSHAVRQSCKVWAGAFWFGIPAGNGPPGRIGPRALEQNTIAVRPGGMEFELLTPSLFRIFGLVIEKQLLLQHIADTEHIALAPSALDSEVLATGHMERDALEHTLRSLFETPGLLIDREQARDALRDVLLNVIGSNCVAGLLPPKASITYIDRHRLVKRVRDFALAHQDEPLSIPQLCVAFHVSRRTLQYAFQDVCGISPGAYLRFLRLNGVRRALRAPERYFLDVQDLAAQWGFWHPSQFACDYKKLFGERPSDTLRRRAELLPFAKS
jgi:AraC family transcriptional regulator, ethanolamine operon transcriptional activator